MVVILQDMALAAHTWNFAGSVSMFLGQKFAKPAKGRLLTRSKAQVPANATMCPCEDIRSQS